MHKVKAGLDRKGQIKAWQHKIVGQWVMAGSMFGAEIEKTGIDPTSLEGIDNSPVAIGDFDLQLKLTKLPVSTLWWRSVGHTHTAYVMETMIDELAEAARKDALSFRKDLIKNSPQHQAMLDLLAEVSLGKDSYKRSGLWSAAS